MLVGEGPTGGGASVVTGLDAVTLEAVVRLLVPRLERYRDDLNRLNVYPVPDGDTGDNLLATVTAIVARLPGSADRAEVVEAIARGALLGGRGSSGVILGQALRAFVKDLPDPCDPAGLAHALSSAATGARAAVADPVEGTILTVAADAAEQARSAAREGGVAEVLRTAAEEGRRSLARTPELLPVLARAGVVDAGGLGYVLFLDALAEAVAGVESPPIVLDAPALLAAHESEPAEAEAGGRFEVLCLLASDEERVGALRQRWLALGDTVAIAGDGDTWRGHVHTDDVAAVLAAADDSGEVSDVEITDLAQQVVEELGLRAGEAPDARVAVVAVAEGDGLVAAYLEAGVARVVIGGATSKPSTEELLRVVDACGGPVVLLAGDKDVVPAAERAVGLSAHPSWLVPVDMLAGLIALESAGADGEPAVCAARLAEVSRAITGVRVQRAVRDTVTELGTVRAGEWLAIGQHGLVAFGPSAEEALLAAAGALVGPATTSGVLALDAEGGDDAVADRLRRAHPQVGWRVLRTNRQASAYGLAVR
jgi:DAK2 domain fusion protein YloV